MVRRNVYIERVLPFIDKDLIKVITGIRRCGKSVVLGLIQEELITQGVKPGNFLSFNFEDMEYAPLCTAQALHDHLKKKIAGIKGKVYLFFDEIQEVADWEKCVNSLRVSFDTDIYITGSNAALLSGELATYLAGRYVEITIYPFSFSEFLELYRFQNPLITESEAFNKYIALGGMPFLHNLQFEEAASNQYLKDVYNSVVLKDIMRRNNIRDVDLLERIILYVMSNTGQPFSATSLSKFLKSENRTVAPETILNYIKACENAFLFYRARRQDLKGKKILRVNEKYYIADHGLGAAVCGRNAIDINLILENIVYMELRRRGYSITVGKADEKEIEFVGEKQGERIYVQVAYLLASPDTIAREFEPLLDIRDNYPKYVLSMDEFNFSREGIIHRNVREWVMEISNTRPMPPC
ncbi:ATPase [Spirochaetia bacterium]|nr:ATPase [Spirochaetia bacterium]